LRIDAQQFFTPEHTPQHLAQILARTRFDGSIAISRTPDDLAGCDSVRGIVARCDSLAELDRWQRHPKFVGVCGPALDPAEVERRATPLDLELPAADALRLVEQHPGLRIALVHLGLPDGGEPWFRAMEQLAHSPQVYVKISGLITRISRPWNASRVRPFVQHALALFGPGRLMFGSDWPACLPEAIWKQTLAAFTQSIGAQSIATREELLGGAACRFYGIQTHDQDIRIQSG